MFISFSIFIIIITILASFSTYLYISLLPQFLFLYLSFCYSFKTLSPRNIDSLLKSKNQWDNQIRLKQQPCRTLFHLLFQCFKLFFVFCVDVLNCHLYACCWWCPLPPKIEHKIKYIKHSRMLTVYVIGSLYILLSVIVKKLYHIMLAHLVQWNVSLLNPPKTSGNFYFLTIPGTQVEYWSDMGYKHIKNIHGSEICF